MTYLIGMAVLVAMFLLGRWSKPSVNEAELDHVDQWRARLREAKPPRPWWHHYTQGRPVRMLAIESPVPNRYAPLAEIDPVPDYVEPIPIGTRHEGRHREGVALGTVAQRDLVCARQQQSVHTCWIETTPALRAPWEIDTGVLDLELFGLLSNETLLTHAT